jgi:hypothetical protein
VKALLLLSLALVMPGCTYSVHQVATGGLENVPRDGKARVVQAEAEQTVILYLTTSTDYADQAQRKLLAQCPNGELYGIEERYSTSHGFLSFTNHLKATAYCVE